MVQLTLSFTVVLYHQKQSTICDDIDYTTGDIQIFRPQFIKKKTIIGLVLSLGGKKEAKGGGRMGRGITVT